MKLKWRELDIKDYGISWLWKHAGGLTIYRPWNNHDWGVHLFVQPSHWKWFHSVEEYDQCLDYWGLGPLFLFYRCNIPNDWRAK